MYILINEPVADAANGMYMLTNEPIAPISYSPGQLITIN